jgi:hypothetical protein
MKLILRRQIVSPKSTVGHLSVDNQDEFWTLEPPQTDAKPRAIPAGTYDVSIRYSPRHKRLIPHVENVPGFEEIEIHTGNTAADTEGCILIGETYSGAQPNTILQSREAFDKLFMTLQYAWDASEPINLSILDPSQSQDSEI